MPPVLKFILIFRTLTPNLHITVYIFFSNHEAFSFTDMPTELCQHVTRFNCKETCGLCHLCNTPEAADRPECPILCANGIKKCLKICAAGKSRCLGIKPRSFKNKYSYNVDW